MSEYIIQRRLKSIGDMYLTPTGKWCFPIRIDTARRFPDEASAQAHLSTMKPMEGTETKVVPY
jgi:hypothetical protein